MRLLIAILALASLGIESPSFAAETGKDRYDMDVAACLAVTRIGGTAPSLSAEDRGHANTMRPLYEKRLVASTPAAGKTSAQAADEVAAVQGAEIRRLQSHNPAQVRQQLEELHNAIRDCAALPVFEMLDRNQLKRTG